MNGKASNQPRKFYTFLLTPADGIFRVFNLLATKVFATFNTEASNEVEEKKCRKS